MKPILTTDFIQKYSHVNFQKMANKESCPRVRQRLLGILNLMEGKNRIEAAKSVGRNPEWLRSWVLRYNESGYLGLFDKKRSGQPKYLADDEEKELVQDILQLQDERNGGRITGNEIREYIQKKYNVSYKGNSIYDLLERIGLSWVSSRSKHPKSNSKAQKAFKQTLKARVQKIKNKKKAY